MRSKSDYFYSQAKGLVHKETGSLSLASSKTIHQYFDTLKLNDFYGLTEAQLLNPDEIRDIMPDINIDGIYAALYMPTDAYIDPFLLTQQLIEEARKHSLDVKEDVNVEDIIVEKNKVVSVSTSIGTIIPRYIVNATGAWAQTINTKLGYHPPVAYLQEQTLRCSYNAHFPSVRDIHENIFISITNDGILVKVEEVHTNTHSKKVKHSGAKSKGDNRLSKVFHRAPFLKELDISKIEQETNPVLITLDGNPIVGQVPNVENAYTAIGILDGICCAGSLALYLNKLIGNPYTEVIPSISTDRFHDNHNKDNLTKYCMDTYTTLFYPIF